MFASFLLHIAVIMLVILLSPSPVNITRVPPKPNTRPKILLAPIPEPSKGGGGGSNSITPPSRGPLPRYARRQFAPVLVAAAVQTPKLAVEQTILLASAETQPPVVSIGLPDGIPGPPSGGSGSRGGIGSGPDGGIGDNRGSSVDGIVAEPMRPGIQAPVAVYKLEPEYSEQARKARVQGTVVLEGVIDDKGKTHAIRVVDGLGFGLDEQAIEAVKLWRFRPATRGGKPLAIIGTFYLTFRLL